MLVIIGIALLAPWWLYWLAGKPHPSDPDPPMGSGTPTCPPAREMEIMRLRITLGTFVVLAAIAGCGGSASTTAPAAGSPSAAAAAAGSPSAAPSPVPSGEAGAICADIGAEIIAGDGAASGVQGAMAVYHISEAQVIAAVAASCPDLSKDMP